MTKLVQFLGTGLLVVSMATVSWADGGQTQGPGLPSPAPPPAECTTNCTNSETTPPAPDATVDTVDVVNMFVTWLVESIL
jgi:hypothetical protein